MTELDQTKFALTSAYEIDPNLVVQFYENMYPERSCFLPELLQWLYRPSFFNHEIPLVIQHDNKVVAHAGMIPFKIELEGKIYSASWYVDLVILPKFQGHGLAKVLTKKWMELPDICVTFCNEKSMGIFKKNGWIESFDTRMHHYFLEPFNHPKAAACLPRIPRKILNTIANPVLSIMIYKKFSRPLSELRFSDVTPETISEFQKHVQAIEDACHPVRDQEYVSWRLLDSPDRSFYSIVSVDSSLKMIIKKQKDKLESQHLDVLWVSDPTNVEQLRKLIATLACWCARNNYFYIRSYVSDPEVSRELAKSLYPVVRHPRFAFCSKDPQILARSKNVKWHWELIDSDFEFTG